MKTIKEFLSQTNSAADFEYSSNGSKPAPCKCAIQFVFLEMTMNKNKQVVFLPDFVPAITKNKGEKNSLVFSPAGTIHPPFKLSAQDEHVIMLWLNFTVNTRLLLDEMIKIITDAKIEASDSLIVYEESDMGMHCTVSLSGNQISYTQFGGNNVSKVYQISQKSQFYLSKFGERPYIIIKESDNTSQFKIGFESLEDVKVWYLAFVAIKQIYMNKQKEAADSLKQNLKQAEVTKPKISLQIEQQQVQQPQPPKEETVEQKQQPKEDPTIKYKQEAEELKEKLQAKLQNYKRSFPKPKTEKEPELDEIDVSQYERPNLEKPVRKEVVHKRKPLNEEELQNLAMERLKMPEVYFTRFAPNLVLQKVEVPDINYNPDTEVSFEQSFINADPTTAFLLVCSIVYNCFIGESLSDFFGVPKIPGESLQNEAAKIVTTLDNDIFKILLENKKLKDNYLPASLARDEDLLVRLQQMKKELINPGEFPSPPPFTFQHRPLQSIVFWFFDSLYLKSLKKLSAATAIDELSKHLVAFFSHYLLSRKVTDPLKEIANKMGPTALLSSSWTLIRNLSSNSDDNAIFYRFWAESFKEGRLLSNFTTIFQYKDTIEKFYDPCSHVRCGEITSQVAGYLQAFEKFELPIDFEISTEGDKSIGQNIMGLLRLVRN